MNTRFILFIGLAAVLFACARPVAPEGGPKDSQPPRVDTLRSTRNLSTRFNPRRIDLTFDEWVVLKDAANQVIVSPPLQKRPDISLKGRTVTVKLDKDEVLRPNTTYTINFGTAVQDLHENNPAKDLRFVFATGDHIDSLTLSGRVSDAFTGDLIENAAVMLYENLADTAIQKELPYYFAYTDKSGQFTIQNVKAGTFRCVAVEAVDNAKLKWNPLSERIGFPDTLITLNDSTRQFLTLKMSKETPRQRLAQRDANRYGRVKLGFAAPLDSLPNIAPDTAGVRLQIERISDSLTVWYDRPEAGGSWRLIVGKDTVQVKGLSREDFLKNHRVAWGDAAAPANRSPKPNQPAPPPVTRQTKAVPVNPFRTVLLPFNTPWQSFDTAFWRLSYDTVRVSNFTVTLDSLSPLRLQLGGVSWQPGKNYQLLLLPGAVTDFFGVTNTDTLERTLLVTPEKQLGSLALSVKNLKYDMPYVVQILDGKTVDQERRFVAESREQRLSFPNLPAVAYTVRIVEDRNGNGRWDPGRFSLRQQPEVVLTRKLEALRANWEVEVEVDLEESSGKKKKE
ncbi:MAG: Ig-like domain-containing protein [Saprospiraceae bacterium]|nr:Ig-like domain-containing protein [Saprospiraceae bacterium]